MNLSFPFTFDNNGRTAEVSDNQHIRNLIEQVLFTAPGERVNRPDFGSGLLQLAFQPNSDEMAATVQFLVQGALHRWLGNLIEVNQVEAKNQDSQLSVTVVYTVLKSKETQVAQFTR